MNNKLQWVAAAGTISAVVFLTLGVGLSERSWADTLQLVSGENSTCGSATSIAEEVTLPFTAGNSFTIDLPASVRYQPGDKAEVVVSGDTALLDNVRLQDGKMSLDCNPGWFASKLDVIVSGPAITDWTLVGSGDLVLAQIDQPELRLNIRGSGTVGATGRTDSIRVEISGSGDAQLDDMAVASAQFAIRGSGSIEATGTTDTVGVEISGSGDMLLRDLNAKSAHVTIKGSGDAQVTATSDAEAFISGSGNLELSGNPTMRRSEVKGSGDIILVP